MPKEIRSRTNLQPGLIGRISHVCVLLVFIFVPSAATRASADAQRSAVDEDGRVVNFQRDIAPIFRTHCLSCHNAEDAKADFRIDVAENVSWYVEAEDVEASSLYVDYITATDEDMLMPPPSHGGPLSPAEISLVRLWIEEGAQWPDDAVVGEILDGSGEELAPDSVVDSASAGLLARVWSFQGFLHPATVHFPIALLLIGALFVVLGWKWPALGTQVPLVCLLIGSASAIAATMMGWSFATEKGYGSWTKIDMDGEIFWHRWSAVIVTVLSTFLAILALLGLRSGSSGLVKTWKIGLLLVAGMVGAVGHQGGELTYGHDFYPKAFRILLGQPEPDSTSPALVDEPALVDQPADGVEVATARSPMDVLR